MSSTGLRPFSSVLALGAFSLIGCEAPESTRTEPAEKPNVLFISVDDLNDWITTYDIFEWRCCTALG